MVSSKETKNGLNSIHLILFIFVLSSLSIPKALAQSSFTPGSDNQFARPNFSPSLAVIIVVLIAALFFVGIFSLYISRCNNAAGAGNARPGLSMRRRAAAARGLDASVIETFPTFTYAEVKDHHIGKGALECAVCLNEFEDNETLRLIPKCDHVFHPECIDAWLESHVTCPVCRADLAVKLDEPAVQAQEVIQDGQEQEAVVDSVQQNDQVSILISNDEEQQSQQQPKQEEDSVRPGVKRNSSLHVPNRPPRPLEEGSAVRPGVKRILSFNVPNRPPRSVSVRRPSIFSKFRSHSTGHSLVVPGENLDRYTLRLPENVRKEVLDRAHLNRTRSCAVTLPRVGSSRRGGYRTGRSEPEGKSDRWSFTMAPPFFSRGLSVKSPKVVAENDDASTSRATKTAVKMPSFKCLEPKVDETSLMKSDSARLPV